MNHYVHQVIKELEELAKFGIDVRSAIKFANTPAGIKEITELAPSMGVSDAADLIRDIS